MLQHVLACVMVQLIVEGNFTVQYNNPDNPSDIVNVTGRMKKSWRKSKSYHRCEFIIFVG